MNMPIWVFIFVFGLAYTWGFLVLVALWDMKKYLRGGRRDKKEEQENGKK